MALKIVKSSEPIKVNSICVMVYGQPGAGKTSLSFTAESPLLLDFDRGAYRSQFRKDSVQIDTWKDVSDISASDLDGYKTVVVDTVGRLLDVLAVHIVSDNPNMRGYGGALSLQGYGALKSAYAGWLKTLLSYGKDVILIAHDKEEKSGDDLIVRPDIQGGSYGEVFKRADGVAYLHKYGKATVLDFSPTDKWVGKNAAKFDTLTVPDFTKDALYMGGVIGKIKDALNSMSEEQVKTMAIVEDWRAKLTDIHGEAADVEINNAVKECASIGGPALAQVRKLITDRAEALGLKYEGEKGKGKFVKQAA